MCTVSIIRAHAEARRGDEPSGLRIVCNRDEHRERSAARPPRWRTLPSGGRAIWPVDTHIGAGGTWVAASEHGLVMAVLNLNPRPPVSVLDVKGLKSRGALIPALIDSATPEVAVGRLAGADLTRYAPFRIIAAGAASDARVRARIGEVRWDRHELSIAWHESPPLCFVSSGLGDHRAQPRLGLFRELVAEPGATPDRQDEFHRHTWLDHPEISVMMSRAEARTVSVTTIEMTPGDQTGRWHVRMRYDPVRERPVYAR